ncbi:glycolate oxidase subunit GlcF [Amphibiibacter pelophylacis]|uniref:Glycolate oxidase subunit GlcF n=1 Tax=Amphibiibacter pelophylacis TaxID=1799477 RepID=A0ACC6P0F1_9BURK
MYTALSPALQDDERAQKAQQLLSSCVHCGFCNATCPTYQLLGNELDGPRGRLYLIKQVLEGAEATRETQQHLDRCLTCRNCETTCPSGVNYVRILDVGREIVDERVERPRGERLRRWMLREGLGSPLLSTAVKAGQTLRPLMPASLQKNIPTRDQAPPRSEKLGKAHRWPIREHARKVLLLLGCVQPSLRPNINSATARVLDAVGIQSLVGDGVGCCGAVRLHLGDSEKGLKQVRQNVDAWWPHIQSGEIERIVMNVSGCGLTVKQYGELLADEPYYAKRAAAISAMTVDVSELLPSLVPDLALRLRDSDSASRPTLVWHAPCTLQHGQGVTSAVQTSLRELGFVVRQDDLGGHLCCGSAGTYSVLQPELSQQLRDARLRDLHALAADGPPPSAGHVLISANIGCISHLQSGTQWPVKHWVEVLDDHLVSG